jgi:hypothetical protein
MGSDPGAYYDDAVSGTIVYLDMCALKRPFDDARSERVRREADAVARIFEGVESGRIQVVVSPAQRFENDRNPREDRRLATELWLQQGRSIRSSAIRCRSRSCRLIASLSTRRMRHEQVGFDVPV